MGKLKIDYKESLLNAQKCIAELEKENAELRRDKEDLIFVRNAKADHINELKADNDARKYAMAMSEKVEKRLREQLTKAKEIIKEFVCNYNNKTIYVNNVKPLLEQAEQFLEEIEK